MGNYIDYRISQRVSRSFRRLTTGKTDIAPFDNGDEQRNARWKFKLMRFVASFAMLGESAQNEVTGAFYAANASLLLFRFRDYGDFKVSASPLTVETGTRTPVQLTKRYFFGPAYADRLIQAVSTCTVLDAADNEVAGVLDNVLGLFTPDSDWTVGQHKWNGTFDVWVRFADDEIDFTMIQSDLTTTDIEFVERRARR